MIQSANYFARPLVRVVFMCTFYLEMISLDQGLVENIPVLPVAQGAKLTGFSHFAVAIIILVIVHRSRKYESLLLASLHYARDLLLVG